MPIATLGDCRRVTPLLEVAMIATSVPVIPLTPSISRE
jgi:hypothetical protein